ncbi:hypothetical protein ACFE04_030514 [Oxalis oulophora]
MVSTISTVCNSSCLLIPKIKPQNQTSSSFFKPSQNPNFAPFKLRGCYEEKLKSVNKRIFAVSETPFESESSGFNKDATIDIKLPRRSLLVQFTCNECGERSERLINRLAYERGLVYVQCAGCLRHHKLIDNLGLVVEYDLRDEISIDPVQPDTDEV